MKMHRLFAEMAAAVLAAGMMALPASASEAPEFNYTPVAGSDDVSYNKYLVMDKDTICPTVTFNYTIASGAAAAATDTDHIEVYAGSRAGVPTTTTATASFTSATTTTDGAADDGIAKSADKKYATAPFTFDFSNVEFPEPGVYRYVVTEQTTSFTSGFTANNTELARTLDVYVKDSENDAHTLIAANYVFYDSVIDTAFAKSNTIETTKDQTTKAYTVDDGKKTDGFVNEYTTYDLEFSKDVTGNQASRDKYFKFTVTISNAPGAIVSVVGAGDTFMAAPTATSATKSAYTATVMQTANSADENSTITGQQLVADEGMITHDFYLQHGQSVKLTGLPKGASYTITEVEEDYVPSVALNGDTKTGDIATDSGTDINTSAAEITDTYLKADTTAAFTNDRTGTIPTGVVIPTAVPVAAGAALLGGVIVITVKRKKREAEE